MPQPSLVMLTQMDAKALRSLSEHTFSVAMCRYAESRGWRVHYERRSGHMGQDGRWRGSGPKGKPDLTLARDGVVILAELKTEAGKPTADQSAWLEALGPHGTLWRPRDAEEILAIL